ncbi:hypothetical protein ACFQVB_44235 [Paraburkholderia humisilvae]|uniref:hypothetical protein n=1 Tax=Paraburkholderia humisilvae TaxID=627669 RepID=UPI00361FCEF3
MIDGIIIATIINAHMPVNDAATCGQLCPLILDQAIDMDQPPGIGIPLPADMGMHTTTVRTALTTHSSAHRPKNTRRGWRADTSRAAGPASIVCAAARPESVVRTTSMIYPWSAVELLPVC